MEQVWTKRGSPSCLVLSVPTPSSILHYSPSLFWGPIGFRLKSTPQSNTQGTSWSGLYPCCQLYFLPCTPFQPTTLAKSNHFIVPVLQYSTLLGSLSASAHPATSPRLPVPTVHTFSSEPLLRWAFLYGPPR